MDFNVLTDEFLFNAFKSINEFATLMDCSKVCLRWEYLVLQRLKKVKYLSDAMSYLRHAYPMSTLFFTKEDGLDQTKISELFPKLRILDVRADFVIDSISDLKIKGLRVNRYNRHLCEPNFNSSIEWLAVPKIWDCFANDRQGPLLKQLSISRISVKTFAEYAKYFPNLQRLYICDCTLIRYVDRAYSGPVLLKMEILEIEFYANNKYTDIYYGFSLADSCPNLRSASHHIHVQEVNINDRIKNHFLEDLVIEFVLPPDWTIVKRILRKYPKLKHIAIRLDSTNRDLGITDENVADLLGMLPCVSVIDIIASTKVTEKSNEYIDEYSRCHGRPISFHCKKEADIPKHLPESPVTQTCIAAGFNFMKNCFEGQFPYVLDLDE